MVGTNSIINKKIKFWYPITATYDTADYSVSFKAPEEDNSVKVARNQSIVRTRAGRSIVYDRGTNLNTMIKLSFKDIDDVDRAQLVVFLEAIQWATSKIGYEDMYGDTYYVRVIEENGIEYRDKGLRDKTTNRSSSILWNFDLDLLNITDNIEELDEEDPTLSSALTLHLLDLDEPHNPAICTTVNIADGAKTIESFSTTDWKSVTWVVIASKDAKKVLVLASITHNRNGVTDATLVTNPNLVSMNEIGDIYSKLTFTSAISGAGSAQVMTLKCTTTEDGIALCVRRTKM